MIITEQLLWLVRLMVIGGIINITTREFTEAFVERHITIRVTAIITANIGIIIIHIETIMVMHIRITIGTVTTMAISTGQTIIITIMITAGATGIAAGVKGMFLNAIPDQNVLLKMNIIRR